MKIVLRIIKIGIIASVLVFLLDAIFRNFEYEKVIDLKTWGLYFFYSFSITLVNIVFSILFQKFVGWKNAGMGKLLASTAGTVIVSLGTYFFCRLVHLTYIENIYTIEVFLEKERLKNYIFPLLFSTTISLFLHLLYFFKATQDQKVKEQKIIAGSATARFDALKNQLDPHFLFNSLNVLSSLIDEDTEMAQKFTGSLSKVYRYVLEQKSKELVTLSEEIKFAKTYTNLLKMRFEDAILFNFPERLILSDAMVVPLSLQLLLENTVKHNKATPTSPLIITIYESDTVLVVKNNLQPKEILKSGSGVGLLNIKERYKLLTNRTMEVLKTDREFMVRLPLLTKKIKVNDYYVTETDTEKKKESLQYAEIQKKVAKQKDFYRSLIAFCIVIPILAVIDFLTSNFPWVIFPTLGWGLSLLFHGFSAFNYNPFFGKKWEERKIKEYMNKN